ncbi:CDP-alcohol phosphatidyltransferase family protein [Porticoccus sp.]|nr:MAG: CDP-alcohol phosphatidyltransferase family protein [Gammaproteobacteria bacterium]
MATRNLVLNLPNVISALRVALMPVLVLLALEQKVIPFLGVLAFSLFSDCLDGYLARRLGQVTELGTRLDSWADLSTYAAMLMGLKVLWPEVFVREAGYLVAAFSAWLVPLLVCLARFRCLPSYHTWSAKLVAILLAPAYFVAVIWDSSLFLRGVLLFYLWVAFEQLVITCILPHWQSNVAGFWRAAAVARGSQPLEELAAGQSEGSSP